MYEVLDNVVYTGNDVMDWFKNYMNREGTDSDTIVREKYKIDDSWKSWSEAFLDFENTAYKDIETGKFVNCVRPEDHKREISILDTSKYHGRSSKKRKPTERQLRKLRKLGVVKKHYFTGKNPRTGKNNSGLYEYVPTIEAVLSGEKVYRQGYFFKRNWLNSETPLKICTSYKDLENTLNKIIVVNDRKRNTENKRGVEAYQFILKAFKDLTEQNPNKKYFVVIAF